MSVRRVAIDDCLGCPSGKAVYESRRVAVAMLKRSHRGTKGLRHYVCPDCRAWHLGHPSTKSRRT